jgi:hypothetical protein
MVDPGKSNRSDPTNAISNHKGNNMSEFEQQRNNIAQELKGLCAHCINQIEHKCKIQHLADQISGLSGVPLIVNDRFNGLLFTK